ncbi:hypothetical protein [Reinekea sp.]|jgi:hypothetical protein|uniref:hypothetical protein n=1 Tax=Reinekea sp. TaxID=1970455 RepID=UPI002A7F2F8C|nr:hypothetical protein [Reinekea sp.]
MVAEIIWLKLIGLAATLSAQGDTSVREAPQEVEPARWHAVVAGNISWSLVLAVS